MREIKQYFSFQWHIADECDQRCKHCYIFPENNCKKLDAMSCEQMRETFYNCPDFCQAYEAAGCQTYFNKKDHLWTLYEYETGAFKIPEAVEEGMIYGGCNCVNCHMTILPILPIGNIYAADPKCWKEVTS